MKSSKVFSAVVFLVAGFQITGCRERLPDVASEPDTDVQSALDAVWATYVVSDIAMISAHLGEADYEDIPWTHIEGTPFVNQAKPSRPSSDERLSFVFNQTRCQDGRLRHGEIRLNYEPNPVFNPFANENSNYFHEFGFAGQLTLSDYRVDSFLITMGSKGAPELGHIINRLPSSNEDPGKTELKWEIRSKFHLQHPYDASGAKDITWEGTMFMVLVNTADESVFSQDRAPAIRFDRALCGFYGDVTGMIGSTPYKLSIKESDMLIRDFSCAPDRVRGVALNRQNGLDQLSLRHHPFVRGVASFNIGDKYPRQIYFGNESNSSLEWQCDNTGELLIKGIAYRVNFRK